MRTITGQVILPENIQHTIAGLVVIEVRDVSLSDAPSSVIAEQRLVDVALKPNDRIAFKLLVPEVMPNRRLAIRVHVSLDGSGRIKSNDLLSTASYPIPNAGTPPILDIPIVVI